MKEYIFRAYDIRGKVPEELNCEGAYRIGLAMAGKYKSVTVGYDIRKTSPALATAFSAGFMEGGGDVAFQGRSSFGLALYSGYLEKKNITVLVSASHLGPEYNGIKPYYSNGVGLSSDEIRKIGEQAMKPLEMEEWRSYGDTESVDHKRDYVDFLASKYNLDGKLKALIDCGGGSVSLVAKDIFSSAGIEGEYLFCKPDPAFTSRPGDVRDEDLGTAKETVKEKNMDVGFAFDGDGDRIGVIDERGNLLGPEQIAIILAKDYLEEKGKGTIVANIECSSVLEDILEPLGGRVVRVPVGHTFMVQNVIDLDAILGLEFTGHFIIPHILGFDDAVPVALEIARIMSENGKRLSELVSEIPIYPRKRFSVLVSEERKFQIMDRIKDEALTKYERVNTIDGVRIDLDNGWVLIRASNTSAKIRVTVEAKDKKTVEDLGEKFVSWVKGFVE